MNKIKTTLENLLRKSVGLAPRGAECCNAAPVEQGESCCETPAPSSCCDGVRAQSGGPSSSSAR